MSRPVLLAVLLAAAACDTVAESPGTALLEVNVSQLSHDPVDLVGVWDLLTVTSSGFGSPPTTTSAADLGWSETYAFRRDGTVDVYRDEVLEERTVYAVETVDGGGAVLHIGGEDRSRRLPFGVSDGRLYVDHRPADGPLLEYARR